MSILEILKEEYLFEDEESPIGDFPKEITTSQEGNIELPTTNRKEVDPTFSKFITKLQNHIDKLFPDFGNFDDAIFNEVRQHIDSSDNKAVLKIKKRLHAIILDEKKKMLERIRNRMERLPVPAKKV